MNEFEERWQKCAAQARDAALPEATAPLGFPERVLAQRRAADRPSLDSVWLRLSLRTLAGVTTVLVVCLALAWHPRHTPSFAYPHVEDTVAELFWML
jgi:hypothetical protein